MEVFANYRFPDIVHSDQGRNFESTVFHQTLEAFGVHKSRTTAYHPQGDGLVERFNRTLLQLLRTYVEKKEEWEKYLPLALFAYRTTIHHSTGGVTVNLVRQKFWSRTKIFRKYWSARTKISWKKLSESGINGP